ncbi:MAG: M23 family metallopeptidase [Minisyncoccales bacterium]
MGFLIETLQLWIILIQKKIKKTIGRIGKKRLFLAFFVLFCVWGNVFLNQDINTSKTSVSKLQNSFLSLESAFQPITNNLIFEQGNILAALPSPLFVSSETLGSLFDEETESKDIIKHIVEKGETLSSIAELYNISIETILLANELDTTKIQPGQELLILPVNGIIHMVEKGETIAAIAKTYSADKEEIISYNSLSSSGEVYIGDVLIIPNGKMPKQSTPTTNAPTQNYAQVVLPNSYFIVPTVGTITQGAHYSYSSGGKTYYTAVDISNAIGTPVVAAAGGQIQIAKNKWPYGNYITILHPNGVVTLYAHLSFIARGIESGATVSQGQVIGYMGNTGRTVRGVGGTGSHLHFETRGAANPLTVYGRGNKISY